MQNAYTEFAHFYDRLMDDVDYDGWCAYLDRMVRALSDGNGASRIMDCACGTGNISVRMAARGYSVIGSDRSSDMLEIAQQKAMDRGLRIPFIQQDMQSFSAHHPLDAVLACCDGVNYLDSLESVSAFFAAARENLRPGGLLLFDLSTEYKLINLLDGRVYGEDTEACTYLWQNVYDPESRLLEMRLAFFVPDGNRYRRFDETHIQRAHTIGEIKRLLEQNGFVAEEVFDAFTTEPPRTDSERIQWIARRKS